MKDWNLVISVYQDGYREARRALRKLGRVERSPYHNVLLMKADNAVEILEAIEKMIEESPPLYDAISRVSPAMFTFDFESGDDFRNKARSVLREWSARLASRSFHARLHRRGAHDELTTREIEPFLDDCVLAITGEGGSPARLSFTDPDIVIAVDTVDHRAGFAIWTREDLAKHRLLRPD